MCLESKLDKSWKFNLPELWQELKLTFWMKLELELNKHYELNDDYKFNDDCAMIKV